jgi:hypothetical protein
MLGCGAGAQQDGEGGASAIEVQTAALSASDAVRVTLRVSGVGISPDIVRDLVRQGSGWRGVIGGIPVGTGRLFHADAYDRFGTIIYQGEATAEITKATTVMVMIVLQQKTPPQPFVNAVPFIDSVVASASQVAPGDQLALGATGHDVDDGDVLSWTWSAAAGVFDAPNTAITKWTAPDTEGQYDITVSLSDNRGGVRSITFHVNVAYGYAHGTAIVVADLNTWPEIARVTATPGAVGAGEAARLLVSVTDADGDALHYAWTDNCSGSFSDTAAPDPTWNAPTPAPASGLCTLTVVVTDVRGGLNTGRLTVQVGVAQPVQLAPSVIATFQSVDTCTAGQNVDFDIEAIDPEGGALTFTWTAAAGVLGPPSTVPNPSGSTTGKVTWTAPASGGSFTVTVVVRDPAGQETSHTFSVTVTGGTTVVDQSQLLSPLDGQYLSATTQLGQMVLSGRAGQLVGIELSVVSCGALVDPRATVELSVSDGSRVIASASRLGSVFGTGCLSQGLVAGSIGTGYFDFGAAAPTIAKNAKLFLTVSFVDSFGPVDSMRVGFADSNPYPAGAAWVINSGKRTDLPTVDLAFKTFVR